MKEEISKIRESLDTLEGKLLQYHNPAASPFSGLELPDIMRDVVDLLFPLLGTYEATFYIYFLRHSIIENGTFYVRTSTRGLMRGAVQSVYAGSTKGGGRGGAVSQISLDKVRLTLHNLESLGAIRKENAPNRDGTLYRILLPEEIEACQQRRHELQKVAPTAVNNLEPDYYNIRENRLKVWERDDYKCRYCGKQLTRFTATLDHVHPVAKGGKNSLENLVTACLECNSKKNVKPLGDFMADTKN
jgi:HNH endonuclease